MGNSFDYQTRRIIRGGLIFFSLAPAFGAAIGGINEHYALWGAYLLAMAGGIWEFFDKKV